MIFPKPFFHFQVRKWSGKEWIMCLLKMYVGNASLSAELIEHTLFDSKNWIRVAKTNYAT